MEKKSENNFASGALQPLNNTKFLNSKLPPRGPSNNGPRTKNISLKENSGQGMTFGNKDITFGGTNNNQLPKMNPITQKEEQKLPSLRRNRSMTEPIALDVDSNSMGVKSYQTARHGVGNIAGFGGPSQKRSTSKRATSLSNNTKVDPFTLKPSDKQTQIKTGDPFAKNSGKGSGTNGTFRHWYNTGGVPCRINHGCGKMHQQWDADVDPENQPFDPLLMKFFDGLSETTHPYNFIAKEGSKQLLDTFNVKKRIGPVLKQLVTSLRFCFMSGKDEVYNNGVDAQVCLSDNIGELLNPYVGQLITLLSKKINNKSYREKINEVLSTLEKNGGEEATKEIKKKVPTYCSMFF